MSKNQKKTVALCTILALSFGITPIANAMHIMEGYLPVGSCITWGALCIPFLAAGPCACLKIRSRHIAIQLPKPLPAIFKTGRFPQIPPIFYPYPK